MTTKIEDLKTKARIEKLGAAVTSNASVMVRTMLMLE
jgi:hypothetical protein